MQNSELEKLVMQLIMNGGNAKSSMMEAINYARNNEFETAQQKIEDAEASINEAHEIQTKLLVTEARGENYQFSLLLTHSQDHLMNALNAIDLGKEIVALWEIVYKKLGGESNE